MPMEQYEGVAEIVFRNRPLAEASSVNTTTNSNANPVNTMKKGLAGRSAGAVSVDLTIESAVPKAGMEDDFVELCQENEDITVSMFSAGKTYTWNGWINQVDRSNSVDSASSVSIQCTCGPADIL